MQSIERLVHDPFELVGAAHDFGAIGALYGTGTARRRR